MSELESGSTGGEEGPQAMSIVTKKYPRFRQVLDEEGIRLQWRVQFFNIPGFQGHVNILQKGELLMEDLWGRMKSFRLKLATKEPWLASRGRSHTIATQSAPPGWTAEAGSSGGV